MYLYWLVWIHIGILIETTIIMPFSWSAQQTKLNKFWHWIHNKANAFQNIKIAHHQSSNNDAIGSRDELI